MIAYKKISIKFLCLIQCLFVFVLSEAQITIQFNPNVYGRSLEGLSYVQLFNNSIEEVKARVTIRVSENQAGDVVTCTFTSVPLSRGNNSIDPISFGRGRFVFGNNYAGQTLSQTGHFAEGEYEYCYEVEITDSKSQWTNPFFQNCFTQQLQPLTPLLLINPPDEDESCNTRPAFLWQLPMPLIPTARCRCILVELYDKQDVAEAINDNLPIINQANIIGNQLPFPANVPALLEGKKYAWQVIVYAGNSVLKRSEIWTYKVKCEVVKEEPAGDSYRELKETEDGNFYIANKVLRFSFNNPYGEGPLNYSIVNNAQPGTPMKNLPKLKMQPGLNKYDIDISENKDYKKGQEYLLKVVLIGNRELRLRFIYGVE